MLTKFWEEVGTSLGSKWVSELLRSSVIFWAGGLLAWIYHQTDGWQALVNLWTSYDLTTQIIIILGVLLLVLVSSSVMEWIQRFLLRAMEGYWSPPFRRLRFWKSEKMAEQLAKKQERWQHLDRLELQHLRHQDRSEYVRLDREVVQLYPAHRENLMPTALGNRLKTAEEYSRVRYGLEAIIVWPRLWSLLPEELRESIAEAQVQLNSSVRLFGWGLLFCIWTIWAWWALPAGGLVATIAWLRALSTAEVYGDLIRTAFDLHRFKLYETLRWPLPADTETEREHGENLTAYLFRGFTREAIEFVSAEGADKA